MGRTKTRGGDEVDRNTLSYITLQRNFTMATVQKSINTSCWFFHSKNAANVTKRSLLGMIMKNCFNC